MTTSHLPMQKSESMKEYRSSERRGGVNVLPILEEATEFRIPSNAQEDAELEGLLRVTGGGE